jgi:formamidopyrimidine-DNA glycosylase
MPELPEVEMARRYLEATSLYQPIKTAKVKDARILNGVSAQGLELSLLGLQFSLVFRHGKRLFLKIQDELWLSLHLGLTGKLVYLESPDEEPRHTRLLVSFQNGRRLAFDDSRIFGEVGLTSSPQSFLEARKIGPDAMQLDLDGFFGIMSGRKGVIKGALLDQGLVAGLGNLYADEALFQAGICPKSHRLDMIQLKALFLSIQEVLKTALSTEANLEYLPDSYLLPNRHPGGTCPRDGAALKHEKIIGRTSYYCPKHQKMIK